MWNDLEQALPSSGGASEILDVESELVTTADRVSELAKRDILVVGLVIANGEPFGLAVSTGPGEAVVVPFEDAGPILDRIGSGAIGVIGHDLKAIARALLDQGYDLTEPRMDTALAAYILNPAQRSYDLVEIAERVLGVEVVSPDDEDTAGMLPFDNGPDVDLEGRRVEAVRRLADELGEQLSEREESDLFTDFELPARAGTGANGARRHRGRPGVPGRDGRGSALPDRQTRVGDPRVGRRDVQRQLNRSTADDSLRQAESSEQQEDVDGQALRPTPRF